uniref:Uncharacterized protein n=1 Tax=Avena sativa TaxID=4498 RepID=A0ACD6AT67_AVESA
MASPLAGVFINQHVPLVLTLHPPNYTQWRTLFEVMFTKSGVADHIHDPPRAAAPYWLQDDAYVVSWLYNRISPEIFGLVHQRHATAAQVWASISTLFLENAEHQVVFLATDFRRIEQGSSSIINYFGRLKECADRLADFGEVVSDRDQVLNMFRGLAPRLHYAIPILTMQKPLPSFLSCRAFLLLEESRQSPPVDGTGADTALHAARAPNSGNHSGGGGQNTHTNSGGGGRGYRGKGKAPATPSAGASSTTARPPALPAPATAPWTGMVHAWPVPWRPHAPGSGILGPRPGSASPFAGTTAHYYGSPPVPAAYGAALTPPQPAPAWDQTALIHALNNLSVQPQQQPNGEWVLDTGATSHMASSSGSAHKDGDPPL